MPCVERRISSESASWSLGLTVELEATYTPSEMKDLSWSTTKGVVQDVKLNKEYQRRACALHSSKWCLLMTPLRGCQQVDDAESEFRVKSDTSWYKLQSETTQRLFGVQDTRWLENDGCHMSAQISGKKWLTAHRRSGRINVLARAYYLNEILMRVRFTAKHTSQKPIAACEPI